MVGCGGGSYTFKPPATGTINFQGTTTVATTSTSSATVPATGGITVTTGDSTTGGTAIIPSGALPAGTILPAGTQLAVIPAGTGWTGTYASGLTVTVNGVANSGITVSTSGVTTVNIALPVSSDARGTAYSLGFPTGDFATSPAAAGIAAPRVLTVKKTVFTGKFYVLLNGGRAVVISPVPTAIAGRLPNNSQNAIGSTVLTTFGPGNNGRSANLLIDYGTGFSLSQGQTIASSSSTFANLNQDSQNVPTTGVALIQFAIGDLP